MDTVLFPLVLVIGICHEVRRGIQFIPRLRFGVVGVVRLDAGVLEPPHAVLVLVDLGAVDDVLGLLPGNALPRRFLRSEMYGAVRRVALPSLPRVPYLCFCLSSLALLKRCRASASIPRSEATPGRIYSILKH